MREIKFRAWDKQDNRMITDEQDLIPLKVTNKGVLRLSPHHENNLWSIIDGDRFEIMQNTGRKDKDNKDIYEYDIVIDEEGRYGVVYWNPDDCQFLVDFQSDMEIEQINSRLKMCGNYWENGELLK